MTRTEIAPGAFITELPGEKFKLCKVTVHLVTHGRRDNATALALLPHVLARRCEAVPDALKLPRLLFSLYGAELSCESSTAGANRVISISVGGLKNEYALGGEDLAGEYVKLLCNILFAPKLSGGVFEAEDVAIEKEKRADFLRSELNDKRSYCLRQARCKLYGSSPLGIESSGYLEDMDGITSKSLYTDYIELLRTAQIEVMVCGAGAEKVAGGVKSELVKLNRAPVPLAEAPVLPQAAALEYYSEPLTTVQGKIAILCTSGVQPDARADAVARVASVLYGGLPTSRLFMNVREKESLCYYCSSEYDLFSGTLSINSGVEHDKTERAAEVILRELTRMQQQDVTQDELRAAKLYMRRSFSAIKNRLNLLMNWTHIEWLKGTRRTLDEMVDLVDSVTAAEVRTAIAAFTPAVEYVITEKKGDA